MPAIATQSLSDSVPVARDYLPAGVNPLGVASFVDRDTNGNVFAGNSFLTISSVPPSKNLRNTKVRARLTLPILTSTFEVDFVLAADVTFTLPDRCTVVQRQDLLAMFNSFSAGALATAMVEELDVIY